jgi:hypothetical protein
MRAMRIADIPTLAGKAGARVTQALGVSHVGQLPAFPRHLLEAKFGAATAALLARLPLAADDAPVRERGPQKSILCERSCTPLSRCGPAGGAAEVRPCRGRCRGAALPGALPGAAWARPPGRLATEDAAPGAACSSAPGAGQGRQLLGPEPGLARCLRRRLAAVRQALQPLVESLWRRLVEDCREHQRLPHRLVLTWRQGYGAPRSRSGPVPPQVLLQLKAHVAEAQAQAQQGGRAEVGGQGQQALGQQQQGEAGPEQPDGACALSAAPAAQALLEGCCALFRAAMGSSGGGALQITRLAVTAAFEDAEQGSSDGQQRISAFLAGPSTAAAAAGAAAARAASPAEAEAPPPPASKQQRRHLGSSAAGEAATQGVPSLGLGAEVARLQQLLQQPGARAAQPQQGSEADGQRQGAGGPAAALGGAAGEGEHDADYRLALELQQQELGAWQGGRGRATAGSRRAGPLHAFFGAAGQT